MCSAPSIRKPSSVQEINLQNHLPLRSPMCCVADWMWYASNFARGNATIAWIAFKHSVPPTPSKNKRHPRKKVCHRPTAPPCVRKQQLQAGRRVDAYLDDVYLVVPPPQGFDTAFHLFAQPVTSVQELPREQTGITT